MTRLFLHEFVSGGGPLPAGMSQAAQAELLREGVAMRDALLADLLQCPGVQITCATSDRLEAGLPPVARGAPVQAVTPGAGEDTPTFVRRLARSHDAAWIIAPETGQCLASLHAAVGASRWIGCDAQAIGIAASKQATRSWLHRVGVPTPLSMPRQATSRWIVKPDDGAGAIDTLVHARLDDAVADLQGRRGATLESFVEGDSLSVTLLVGPEAARPLACNRQRVRIDASGCIHFDGVDVAALDRQHDERVSALRQTARAAVQALPGLRGVVGVDLVWHAQHGPVVIEVNPRLTCAYVGLSAWTNFNVAGAVLRHHISSRPAPLRTAMAREPLDVER